MTREKRSDRNGLLNTGDFVRVRYFRKGKRDDYGYIVWWEDPRSEYAKSLRGDPSTAAFGWHVPVVKLLTGRNIMPPPMAIELVHKKKQYSGHRMHVAHCEIMDELQELDLIRWKDMEGGGQVLDLTHLPRPAWNERGDLLSSCEVARLQRYYPEMPRKLKPQV